MPTVLLNWGYTQCRRNIIRAFFGIFYSSSVLSIGFVLSFG